MSLQVIRDPREDAIGDAAMLHVLRYWQARVAGGRLPARADIAPGDLIPALPHLILVDVEGGEDFRFRLVGTSIVENVGRDGTGTLLQETYLGDDFDEIVKDYKYVVEARRPCLTINALDIETEPDPMVYRRLLLPLARDGENVDMLLGVMQFNA